MGGQLEADKLGARHRPGSGRSEISLNDSLASPHDGIKAKATHNAPTDQPTSTEQQTPCRKALIQATLANTVTPASASKETSEALDAAPECAMEPSGVPHRQCDTTLGREGTAQTAVQRTVATTSCSLQSPVEVATEHIECKGTDSWTGPSEDCRGAPPEAAEAHTPDEPLQIATYRQAAPCKLFAETHPGSTVSNEQHGANAGGCETAAVEAAQDTQTPDMQGRSSAEVGEYNQADQHNGPAAVHPTTGGCSDKNSAEMNAASPGQHPHMVRQGPGEENATQVKLEISAPGRPQEGREVKISAPARPSEGPEMEILAPIKLLEGPESEKAAPAQAHAPVQDAHACSPSTATLPAVQSHAHGGAAASAPPLPHLAPCRSGGRDICKDSEHSAVQHAYSAGLCIARPGECPPGPSVDSVQITELWSVDCPEIPESKSPSNCPAVVIADPSVLHQHGRPMHERLTESTWCTAEESSIQPAEALSGQTSMEALDQRHSTNGEVSNATQSHSQDNVPTTHDQGQLGDTRMLLDSKRSMTMQAGQPVINIEDSVINISGSCAAQKKQRLAEKQAGCPQHTNCSTCMAPEASPSRPKPSQSPSIALAIQEQAVPASSGHKPALQNNLCHWPPLEVCNSRWYSF
jgi:hypothetical protein